MGIAIPEIRESKEGKEGKTSSTKLSSTSSSSSTKVSKFILYTDYNFINIDLNKTIPEKSIINRDRIEKQRNSEWIKKVGDYHKDLLKEHYNGNIDINVNALKGDVDNNNSTISLENDNFKINSRFSSILAMKYLKNTEANNRMLVIENDWNKILKTLPDAIIKANYKS